jgi:hypothetical protein
MDVVGVALLGAELAKAVKASVGRIQRMEGWRTTDASLWIGPELHRLDDAAKRLLLLAYPPAVIVDLAATLGKVK